MSNEEIEIVYNKENGLKFIENSPVVIHCHHYNCFLQRTLEDALGEKFVTIQINAAKIEMKKLLDSFFSKHPNFNQKDVFEFATKMYKKMGLGIIDFSQLKEKGGLVSSPVSHYAFTWLEKFGQRKDGVCYFTSGFIQATASKAFKKDINYYKVYEISCLVQNSDCKFKLEVK